MEVPREVLLKTNGLAKYSGNISGPELEYCIPTIIDKENPNEVIKKINLLMILEFILC